MKFPISSTSIIKKDSILSRNSDLPVESVLQTALPTQFSFVTIHGTAKIVRQKYNELLKWNTRIAERYMGRSNAKAYGKRNSTEGVVLVRVKPTKIIAEKDVAAWE